MSILRDFQDDPETWAGHTGDLLKVKGKPSQNYSGLAYELDSDGEPDSIPKHYYLQEGEMIMFLGRLVNVDAITGSASPALMFFSLRTHQKIGVLLRHFNIFHLEDVSDDHTSET